jgi:hypothetical protein
MRKLVGNVAARIAVVAAIAAAVVGVSFGSVGSARTATPPPPGFYGVAPTTALQAKDFQRLARANILTSRITMYWPVLEKGGGYDWLNFDSSVVNATTAGVTLIPTLIGSPKEISENPFRPPLDSAAEEQKWQDFVRAGVRRYGPGGEFWDFVRRCPPETDTFCRPDLPYRPLTVWQVWNEPNLGVFWLPSPSPEEYGRLLQLTGDAIHDVDPNAEVITGGIMPGGDGAKNAIDQNAFLARMYRTPGLTDSFEGVDLHPYQRKPHQVQKLVASARAVTQTSGDGDVPLWITEVGWSTDGSKGDQQVTNRRGQARRLAQTFRVLTGMREAYGIRLASWFTYEDAPFGKYCDWCPGAGLLDHKKKPKPSWRKYAKLAGGKP